MLLQHNGLTYHDEERATPGFKLFSPTLSDTVNLIDLNGEIVHQWSVVGRTTNANMLLPNGNLFIAERGDEPAPIQVGAGGLLREYDWDGDLVWEHRDPMQHHDARRLPNGGAVYIAWELMSGEHAARVGGGVTGTEHPDGIYSEVIREIDEGGNVTFEWHATDLIDRRPFHHNANRENYGHSNAVHPLPNGDYLVSLKTLNTLVRVDRQTGQTSWEYQNDELGGQHDVQMTDRGTVLVFGNGIYARDLHHSAVWEIDPDTNDVVWKYTAQRNAMSFFSPIISSCQRLSSGNTFICEGTKGCLFEVTPDGDVVWEYINPFWSPNPRFNEINFVFRSRHYDPESPEIAGRV